MRRPGPLPKIVVQSADVVLVDGQPWTGGRLGAAVLNATQYCGCERCNSCLVGAALLKHFKRTRR